MFHEDFDRSTHNSFFSSSAHGPSFSGLPGRTPSQQQHIQQQMMRDRLPPIQTQLIDGSYNPHRRAHSASQNPQNGDPMSLGPTGRSSTTSPESYFAAPVIARYEKRHGNAREKGDMAPPPEMGLAALAGLDNANTAALSPAVVAKIMGGFAPVKTNTSSALGAVGSSRAGVLSDLAADKERERKEREERRNERREKKERKDRKSKEKEKEGKRKHKDKERKKDKYKAEPTSSAAGEAESHSHVQPEPSHPTHELTNLLAPGSGPLHPSLNPHSPHAPFHPMSSSTPVDGLGAPIPELGSRSATPTSAQQRDFPRSAESFTYSQGPLRSELMTNLAPDLPPAQVTASTSQFILPPEMTMSESPLPMNKEIPGGGPVGLVVPGIGVVGIGRPPEGATNEEAGPSAQKRPPPGQRMASLPEYTLLDPMSPLEVDGGYGVGLTGAPARLSTVNEKNEKSGDDADGDGHSSGSSSRDYGTSYRSRRQTGEFGPGDGLDLGPGDEEDVSIIGSGADDLRPNGIPLPVPAHDNGLLLDGVDFDHGEMANPSAHIRSPDGVTSPHLQMPSPHPHGLANGQEHRPSPAVTDINAGAKAADGAQGFSSRRSALETCPPGVLVTLLFQSEAEYENMTNLYTQALAQVGLAKHELKEETQRWTKTKVDLQAAVREREDQKRELGERIREEERKSKGLEGEVKKRERAIKDLKAGLAETEREVEREKEKRARETSARRAAEEALGPARERIAELENTLNVTKAKAREQVAALEAEKEDIRMSLTAELADTIKELGEVNSKHTMLQLQHQQTASEYSRAKQAVKNLEEMLAKAQEDAAEARKGARKMKAEVSVLLAREQGKREGWEEGMKRGKGMAEALAVGVGVGVGMSGAGGRSRLVGDGMAFIEEVDGDRTRGVEEDIEEEQRRRNQERKRRAKEKEKSRLEQEKHQQEKAELLARLANLEAGINAERAKNQQMSSKAASETRAVEGRVQDLQSQLAQERELRQQEAQRMQAEKDRILAEAKMEQEAERRRLEDDLRRIAEEQRKLRQKEEDEARDRKRREEEEEARQRRREEEAQQKEAEKERARQAEQEARDRLIEAGKKKIEETTAELRAQLQKTVEDHEQLKKNVEAIKTPVIQLSYLPMPPPPQPPSAPPGVTTSNASSSRRRKKRGDRDGSGSDTASEVSTLSILKMPGFDGEPQGSDKDRRGRKRDDRPPVGGLGTIHEMPSVNSFGGSPNMRMPSPGGRSPGMANGSPGWVMNPPANLAQGGMPISQSYINPAAGMGMPSPNDYLSPPGQGQGWNSGRPELKKSRSGSTSGSSHIDITVVPPSRPHSSMNEPNAYPSPHTYLSPNSARRTPQLPQPRIPGPYDRPPSAGGEVPTVPNSPYHGPGGLPPGFVPTGVSASPHPSHPGAMPMPTVSGRNIDRGVDIGVGGGSSMRPDAGSMMPQPTSSMGVGAGYGMPQPSSAMTPGAGSTMPQPESSMGTSTYGMPQPRSSMTPGAGSAMPRPGSSMGGSTGYGMPQPTSSMTPGAGSTMPRPESSMGVGAGYGMPQPSSAMTPGAGSTMPRPRSSMGGGVGFPEPNVPIYAGVPTAPGSATASQRTSGYGSARQTPAGGDATPVRFPEPGVPNIVPGDRGGRTPRLGGGEGLSFPEPNVQNVVPSPGPAPVPSLRSSRKAKGEKKSSRKSTSAFGSSLEMPEPTVPSFQPSPSGGSITMPQPLAHGYPNKTPTPPFPPVIPDMPGGMAFGPAASPATAFNSNVGMPAPSIVDYTGGNRTPGSVMPVVPASGMTMPTPSMRGTPLGEGPPVIPGVTTSIGGAWGDPPPFIPPADVMARAESRGSNVPSSGNAANGGGGGSGLFGSLGKTFGGGGWGSWGGVGGSGNENSDEQENEGVAVGGGAGGFIPPGVRDEMEDDEVDPQTKRNTELNAQLSLGGENGFAKTKTKKKGKRK